MCKAKADGGYRCATHGEERRRELTDKLHEIVMKHVPESEQGSIGRGFTLPNAAIQHIEEEARADGSVRVADGRVKRATKATQAKMSEVTSRITDGDLDGVLMDHYAPYRDAYNMALENGGQEEADEVARIQKGYFLAAHPHNNDEAHAAQALVGSPEETERREAVRAQKEAFARAKESRREEVARMVDPRFREALTAASDTEAGKKAIYNLAMHRVEARFSDAYGGNEYRARAKMWRDMGLDDSDETIKSLDQQAEDYESAHEVVGTRNRAMAYAERVSAGKYLKPGEEVEIAPGLTVVHASDQKPGTGRYREGTKDCQMAVSMEWMRAKKALRKLATIEMGRLSATKFHADAL